MTITVRHLDTGRPDSIHHRCGACDGAVATVAFMFRGGTNGGEIPLCPACRAEVHRLTEAPEVAAGERGPASGWTFDLESDGRAFSLHVVGIVAVVYECGGEWWQFVNGNGGRATGRDAAMLRAEDTAAELLAAAVKALRGGR